MATTVSSDLTSYDSGYSAYSVSNLNNALAGSDSTTYGQINLTRGSGAVTEIYFNFGLNIPTGATDISVSCTCKCYNSQNSASRVATRQAQLFSGTTAMGSPYTLTNSTTAFSITAGTWTAAQLNNAKLRLYGVRGSSSTTSNYYFRLYGATMEVTYTAPAGNKVYVKSGGSWVQSSKQYIKVNGTWAPVNKVFKKVNGSWVQQSDISALFDPNAIYKKG